MENIYIEHTSHTPEVYFDMEEHKLHIVGKSYPEDASRFYEPIVAWLEGNISEIKDKFSVEFQFDYFNTSSSKYILRIFLILEDFKKAHPEVALSIIWKYHPNDEEMMESGQEYQQFVTIPFEFVEENKD